MSGASPGGSGDPPYAASEAPPRSTCSTPKIAAVPRAALVVLIAALHSFGLPAEGAALLIGIDAILDMGRTAVNVLGPNYDLEDPQAELARIAADEKAADKPACCGVRTASFRTCGRTWKADPPWTSRMRCGG